MFCDQDILVENRVVLGRRYRLLKDRPDIDYSLLGLSAETAAELVALNEHQVERAADAAAPLFTFSFEDQIIRMLQQSPVTQLGWHTPIEQELKEDALLLLTNRWSSSRFSPSFAGTVLGLSRRLIDALSNASYPEIRRVASSGLRPRICVKSQYLFHGGRNVSMHRGQRTHLVVCNSRSHSF